MAEWPWSALGIGETSDKEAIRTAYAAQKAELNKAMQISAFARLTEAREKALFLASEMLRAAERGDCGPAGRPSVVAPPPIADLAPPPVPPEIALPEAEELDAEDFRPAPVDATALETESPARAPETGSGRIPRLPVAEYVDPSFEQAGRLVVGRPKDVAQSSGAPSKERTSSGCVVLVLLLVAVFAFTEFAEYAADRSDPSERVVQDLQDRASSEDLAEADRLLAEALGADATVAYVGEREPRLVAGVLGNIMRGNDPHFRLREDLRVGILSARDIADRETLIAIDRLYLDWLRAARDSGNGNCREVLSRSFFEGIPQLSGESAVRERQVARDLLDRGWLRPQLQEEEGYTIPEDIAAAATAETGLSVTEIARALGDETHPAACDARIAVVEAALADPEEAPTALLRAI
ncbi:hypothetical protein Q9K02_00730 [Qipengyuania sp. G39]|uniref:J domain-containing protein n=1 Tax=Qipengyuania profundimaris TaxID=3067652 RepID=A0ABT9HKM0_9SPHN|nr:hypothetical protein [Qipengyuania sp. G39]MDP4573661.1 hypothetical protein [Qipengyuania sp. G39]